MAGPKDVKGCLSLIIPALVIAGVFMGKRYLDDKKAEKIASTAVVNQDLPSMYKSKIILQNLKLKIMQGNKVHMTGPVYYQDDKYLSNVRLKLVFMTKAKPGEVRPEFVDIGAFEPRQTRKFNQYLYTIPGDKMVHYGGHYRFDVDTISF